MVIIRFLYMALAWSGDAFLAYSMPGSQTVGLFHYPPVLHACGALAQAIAGLRLPAAATLILEGEQNRRAGDKAGL